MHHQQLIGAATAALIGFPPLSASFWPLAAVTLGIGANAVWVRFLGYGLFALVEMAIKLRRSAERSP